ncbi:MAG: type II toxin-antitoxin system VapC family toxin [Anaerolineae bacterium]|nr:type II toxin-antitoxin system VapC family toxin [Anaerolineae bacterium]NUQ05771.1 type II toxin-antitoxin system VapC family toxin [Anaerolineae bacterium]
MKYLLDTNTCIRYLNGRSPAVYDRLNKLSEDDICVCSVVKLELRYGALRSDFVEKTLEQQETFLNRFVSLAFDDVAHVYAAQIRADLAKLGMPIGPNDLLIAAIAVAHDLTLVTHNTREFGRIAGLKVEDWESDDGV